MTELKELIMQKAGITEEQAQNALQTVLQYLKDKSPSAIHGHLDKMAAGDKLEEVVKSDIKDVAQDVKEKSVETFKNLGDAAESAASKLKQKLDDFTSKKS